MQYENAFHVDIWRFSMKLLSRIVKKLINPSFHFGTHNTLQGHLVDSHDDSNNGGGGGGWH